MRSGHKGGNKGGFQAKGQQESYNAFAHPHRQRDDRIGDDITRSPGRFGSGNGWTDKKDGYHHDRDQRHGNVGTIATPSRSGGKGGHYQDYGGSNGNRGNNGSYFHHSPDNTEGRTEKPARSVSELEECLRRKGVDAAWELLDEMQSKGVVADKYTVSRMLMKTVEHHQRSSLNISKVNRGITLVESFIDTQPGDVDEVLFNALLDTCCRLRDIKRLEVIIEKMRKLKIKPSAVTLGILVKTYGQAGDLDKVLEVWQEMACQRDHANAVTFGCMLDACIKCGNLQKAVEVFRELKAEGKHKNTILYTTLIKGYGKSHDLQNALQLFDEMKHEGVAYNTVTFNSIIDVCVKCADIQTAEAFMQKMTHPSSEVEPDLITFSTLLKGYCQLNEVDKALQIFQNIKQRQLTVDELVYNTLMDGCVKVNDLATGAGLFEEMLHAGLRPSAITHSILVRLYKHTGFEDAQEAVAQLFEQHGLERPQYNDRDRNRGGKGEKGGRDDWNRGPRGDRSQDWERKMLSSPGGKGKGPGRKGSGQFLDGASPPQTPNHDWPSSRNFGGGDDSPFPQLLPLDALRSPLHDFLSTPNSGAATPVPGACTPGGSWAAFGPMNIGCGMGDGSMSIGNVMNSMQCVPPLPGSSNNPMGGNSGSSMGGPMGGSWFGMSSTGDGNMWGGQEANSVNRSPMSLGMGSDPNSFSNQGLKSPSSAPGSMLPPWPQKNAFQMPMNQNQMSMQMSQMMSMMSNMGNMGSMGNMGNMGNIGNMGNASNMCNMGPMGTGSMGNMASIGKTSNIGNMGNVGNAGPIGGMGAMGSMGMEMGNMCFMPNADTSNPNGNMCFNGPIPCNDPLPAIEVMAAHDEAQLLPNGLLGDSPQDTPVFACGQQEQHREEQQPELLAVEERSPDTAPETGADSLPASPDRRNCPTTPEQYASYPMPSTPSPGGCHENAMPMMGMNMMQQSQDQVQFMQDLQYSMAVGPQEPSGQYFGPVGPQQCQELPSFSTGLAMNQPQQQTQVWMPGSTSTTQFGGCPTNGQQMPTSYWGDNSECELYHNDLS